MPAIPVDRARRIALHAQGLARPRPPGRVDVRHLRGVLERLHVVQLDAVSVVARAHYLPFFARLGAYPTDRLDRLLWRSGEAFEYEGHEASVMPVRLHRLMRHRMAAWPRPQGVERLHAEQPGYVERVLEEVARRGPVAAAALEDPGRRRGPWWGWSRGRLALSWLYVTGAVAVHHRDARFVIHYDVPGRVLPPEVLDEEAAPAEEAHAELLLLAARALGVATAADLGDYWRLRMGAVRRAIARLLARGALREVRVRGWDEPAYLHPDAVAPRDVAGRALLAPFDPLVWYRPRAERLFGFHYRIEIYVPAPRRRYGYYVLPFLLGDRLVARVDVKADRASGRLVVPGAFAEPGADRAAVARELAAELRDLAGWLGLGEVEVGGRGDLAPALRPHV